MRYRPCIKLFSKTFMPESQDKVSWSKKLYPKYAPSSCEAGRRLFVAARKACYQRNAVVAEPSTRVFVSNPLSIATGWTPASPNFETHRQNIEGKLICAIDFVYPTDLHWTGIIPDRGNRSFLTPALLLCSVIFESSS